MQDQKKSENELYIQIALITALYGKPASEAVDRVEAFIQKYNPITGTPETTQNLYGIGLIGYFLVLLPTGSTDPTRDAVLAIDMRNNFVFIDAMGMFGEVQSAQAHYDKLVAEKKEATKAAKEAMNPEMDEAAQDRLLDKLDPKNSNFH